MSSSTSPVKRTKTLAEIKAQMKAKRLAVASASPGNSAQKVPIMAAPQIPKHPVKIAQPIFCPTSDSSGNLSSFAKSDSNPVSSDKSVKTERSAPVVDTTVNQSITGVGVSKVTQNTTEKAQGNKEEVVTVKKETEASDQSAKNKEKIILKIKGGVVKNCSVKLEMLESAKMDEKPTVTDDDDDDDGEIIRKNRKLSQVIVSSGESSDDFDEIKNSLTGAVKLKENYSMLSQLALPASYSGKPAGIDHSSLLKRPQKSPVFGEPAFEAIPTVPSKATTLVTPIVTSQNSVGEQKLQPFMTDGPVIGFQDIPLRSTLPSSAAPTFAQPTSTMSVSAESQKYRSTSKGKSLVQMQQLARTNKMHSDESDLQDSDTEDDSTASSADEEKSNLVGQKDSKSKLQKQDFSSGSRPNNRDGLHDGERAISKKKLFDRSDCDDSGSTSSGDDKPIIAECICACKRLVLCKGCGAYTHEECLSAKELCSLCV